VLPSLFKICAAVRVFSLAAGQAAIVSAQLIRQTPMASALVLICRIWSDWASSTSNFIRALVSQKRITSSTPILNHDVAKQLPLPPQLHGRGQVGLLTIPADQTRINRFLQRAAYL